MIYRKVSKAALFLVLFTGSAIPREGHSIIDGSPIGIPTGYLQLQFYVENEGFGDIYTSTHNDGFRIRRGRVAISADSPVSYHLELNGSENGVFFENAWLGFAFNRNWNTQVGHFQKAFGDEFFQFSYQLPFPQRARVWAHFLGDKKGDGLGFNHNGKHISWNSTLFYSFTDGYGSVRRQEASTRVRAGIGRFYLGGSILFDSSRFEGADLGDLLKSNAFIGFRSTYFSIGSEFVGLHEGNSGWAMNGYGVISYLLFNITQQFELGLRNGIMVYNGDLPLYGKETGVLRYSPDPVLPRVIDLTLCFNIYFSPEKAGYAKFNRVSINYNPVFLGDGTVGQSFYLITQAGF